MIKVKDERKDITRGTLIMLRLFIYYHDERFDVGSGDDGYYGGGFYLRVTKFVKEKSDDQ